MKKHLECVLGKLPAWILTSEKSATLVSVMNPLCVDLESWGSFVFTEPKGVNSLANHPERMRNPQLGAAALADCSEAFCPLVDTQGGFDAYCRSSRALPTPFPSDNLRRCSS